MTAPSPHGIVLRNAYGEWTATPEQLDWAMATLLPASVAMLRARFEESAAPGNYERVDTVAEFLIMLCDIGHRDRPTGTLGTTNLSSAQAARLNEVRTVARAAIEQPLVGYIPSRWPHTYAADFVRGHPQLLPDSVRAELDGSRRSASAAIRAWAQTLDLPADALKAVLADAYLEENQIPLHEAAAQRERQGT